MISRLQLFEDARPPLV